jgi:hypothetical protein
MSTSPRTKHPGAGKTGSQPYPHGKYTRGEDTTLKLEGPGLTPASVLCCSRMLREARNGKPEKDATSSAG